MALLFRVVLVCIKKVPMTMAFFRLAATRFMILGRSCPRRRRSAPFVAFESVGLASRRDNPDGNERGRDEPAEDPGVLPVRFRSEAAEAETVVTIGTHNAAALESRASFAATGADVPCGAGESTNRCWGHACSFSPAIMGATRDTLGHTLDVRPIRATGAAAACHWPTCDARRARRSTTSNSLRNRAAPFRRRPK